MTCDFTPTALQFTAFDGVIIRVDAMVSRVLSMMTATPSAVPFQG